MSVTVGLRWVRRSIERAGYDCGCRRKAALELGDGCELSDATGSSYSTTVMNGAILVLNGGKTAAGTYIRLSNDIFPAVSYPLISVPKAYG